MENDLVVVALPRQSHKVLDRLGDLVGEQVDVDIALGRMEDCFPTERTLRSRDGQIGRAHV